MNEIRCLVKRSLWWMVLLAALEGGFMLIAPLLIASEQPKHPHAASPWFLLPLSLPMAAVLFYAVIQMSRSLLYEEVIANDDELRWRGAFGPWKTARWEEISDFYLHTSTSAMLETSQGKLRLNSGFANLEQLKTFIAARATKAPAREWEMEKFRASKPFTQRFSYWTKSQQWLAPGFLGAFGLLAVSVVAANLFSPQPHVPSAPNPLLRPPDMAWALFYLPLLVGIALFGTLTLLCVLSVWLMWHERRAAFLHRDEHLEISPRGLAWQKSERRIEAAWHEVRAIHRVPGRGFKADYRIETSNGDFTVWKSLETLGLWIRLVRQFAPHLAPPASPPTTEIGGESRTWSGGKIGEGARIFHFRTSETRTILWAPTLVSPCLLLIPSFCQTFQTPEELSAAPTSPWLWFGIAAAIFATVLCWIVFARAAIFADETGLEWRIPFWKTRRVPWNEIKAYGRDENGVFLGASGKKWRLWRSFAPARQGELLELIAARATNARGHFG